MEEQGTGREGGEIKLQNGRKSGRAIELAEIELVKSILTIVK